MNNILLISEDYLKTNSNLNSNAFGKWVLPAIRESQEMGLMPIIGECLYEKVCLLVENGLIGDDMYVAYKDLLDGKIQPYLLYQTLSNIVPLINSKLANIGTVATNDEHIVNLSQGESDLVQNYYRERADFYAKRLQEWVKSNSQAFPELECDCGKMEPNLHSSANSVGIFLGGRRGKVVSNGDCGCSSKGGSSPVTGDCAGVYLSGYTSGYTKGYDSGYTSGYTDGAETCDCDEAYNEGKADGMAEQKAKLVSTAITSNGTYQRADGFNRVEINVPTTGYTQQDLDNAYASGMTSGITSGETRQKAKLATTAFTANGTFQRADGWSAITVDVSGGGGALQYKSVSISETAATITPDSGYVGMSSVDVDASEVWGNGYNSGYTDGMAIGEEAGFSAGYESGVTDGYASGYTSGYTDGRDSFNIETGKTVEIHNKVEIINPSDGYDAMSSITVDATTLYNDAFVAGIYYNYSGQSNAFLYQTSDGLTAQTLDNYRGLRARGKDGLFKPVTANTYPSDWGIVEFSESIVSMDGALWNSAANVTKLIIPEGFGAIGYGVYKCSSLSSVTFPSTLIFVGDEAFGDCGLLDITLGDSVTNIAKVAFYNNPVTSITIGSACTYIGKWAFGVNTDVNSPLAFFGSGEAFRSSLTEIKCYATTAPTLEYSDFSGERPFRGRTGAGTLYVPTGSESSYQDWLNCLPSGWTISATL